MFCNQSVTGTEELENYNSFNHFMCRDVEENPEPYNITVSRWNGNNAKYVIGKSDDLYRLQSTDHLLSCRYLSRVVVIFNS